MVDLFTNGENHRGKTPPIEFKVTSLKNPLLSKYDTMHRKDYDNVQLVHIQIVSYN